MDQKESGKGLGVPRTPSVNWGKELEQLKVSYTGEVVQKSRPLTLEQILPGLPKAEHGAIVPLEDLCSGEVKEKLLNPRSLLKDDICEDLPFPQVSVVDGEWPKIVRALYDRGLVRPVEHVPKVGEVRALNGAFGVIKEGKTTESGLPVLRFIMDLRATNMITEVISGDVATLSGAASYQHVILDDGELLAVSGDDLTAAFYLFSLPKAWSELMVFREKVKFSDLGLPGEGETFVGAAALPMGWHSAVGVMQHLHRELALRGPEKFGAALRAGQEIRRDGIFPDLEEESLLWSIYLDDTTFLEKVSKMAYEQVKGVPPDEQENLRRAYRHWGIPTNPDKALQRTLTAERLGARIDGEAGTLGVSTNRVLQLMGLGSYLRTQKRVSRRQLQIYCGKAVHLLQFRRCLFSFLEDVWQQIAGSSSRFELSFKSWDEMLCLEAVLPMAYCDLRAKLDPLVTASDACETGGGTCFSSRLTHMGKEEATRIKKGEKAREKEECDDEVPGTEKILVFDFFSGLGGLPRALERAGATITHMVFVEKDKDLRRCHRRAWPGSEEKTDITKLTKESLRACLKRVPGITGVVAGGGSPCQGLSKLSSERTHLEDSRSALFYVLARHLKTIEKEAKDRGLWYWGLVENVVPDEKDVKEISDELGWDPLLIEAAHLSRARRPRLYWSSVEPASHPEVEVLVRGKLTEVKFVAPPEPTQAFLSTGWSWKAEEGQKEEAKFPTFTRAIPRRRPPPSPAGLEACSEEVKARWKGDGYRYPPYTYKDIYMVEDGSGTKRPLRACEREILMGFMPGHVKLLRKKDPDPSDEGAVQLAEDAECCALGNSFHTGAVACLADLVLWTLGKKKALKGAKRIQAEFLTALGERRASQAPESEASEDGEDRVDVSIFEGEGVMEAPDYGDEDSESVSSHRTAKGNEKLEELQTRRVTRQSLREREFGLEDLGLSTALVGQFVRRQEFRGSDVRLDLGLLYRPDAFPRSTINPARWQWATAHAYPFNEQEHINVLELRALLMAFEWRSRRGSSGDERSLHLTDSQVALSVAVKGRSSSKRLNWVLRRFAGLQVAHGIWPILCWVESHLNPADEPSRRF